MNLIRNTVFLVFFILYLILCPFLIFYSLGYIFNPLEKALTQTGLISISTLPQGAEIYLGNSRYIKRTPAVIDELLPGRFSIILKLKLEGYKPWTHRVRVEPGRAVAFENILLIPQRWKIVRIKGRKDIPSLHKKGHKEDTGRSLWIIKGSVMLSNDNGQLKLIQVVPQEGRHVEDIVRVKRKTDVYYSQMTGWLYYLDERTGHPFKIQIVPGQWGAE